MGVGSVLLTAPALAAQTSRRPPYYRRPASPSGYPELVRSRVNPGYLVLRQFGHSIMEGRGDHSQSTIVREYQARMNEHHMLMQGSQPPDRL